MVNSKELIGTTGYMTLQTRCRIPRCRYNRVRLYIKFPTQCVWGEGTVQGTTLSLSVT
jgi:hypothetical protein